ncbi:MAG: PilT/PilU family type 4a pilus ATPase [Nitrospinaceae bacterium]|nr:PilT/PilU family type 4a pilus ATPase [Nitrospinaceae bacterium]NIR53250.1 PilT/PilU family type 4a pilus ATPase [Nitrospinaceae bacterium]NIS83648.1 PilT/PilU family type 4a pilus ATPase [Nitrospinaceae bacterium]NIU42775.1 PilT/PilU family type 4a pilus ATPase [Nitrospinaceae bacterium]NIU94839.1 PilT/PilU family type 4a pilus ATPase [Nitrospinaceae bacterium]
MRKPEIDQILTTMLEAHHNISDLNITVGKPFQVEAAGNLMEVPMAPPIPSITPYQAEVFALNLIHSDRRLTEILIRDGSCDTSYFLVGKVRFRVNIFSQRGNYSIVLRKLETLIPTIEDLELPKQFARVAREKNGLVLVTGATGSGKTTTLAAILDKINNEQSIHIITLEDPVEFVHPHKKSTFNQRELGADFSSFATGLRASLRQAPKVILVGEMRDRETVEIGLSASETGHLVLSTLHTVDAGQTINRIIGMFSKQEEQQIRIRLADSIRWIISQRLVPRVGGGRVPLIEIMSTSLRVKDAILNGEQEGKTFYEIIKDGDAYGMWTFDQHILKRYKAGEITEETAMAYASRRAIVGRGIDTIKAAQGQKTTDIEGLTLDDEYQQKIRK